jgi:DNA-directed RNA polymerase specialized sigma subunit, sigma24 homolog
MTRCLDDIDIDALATTVIVFGEEDSAMVDSLFIRTREYMAGIVRGAASGRQIQPSDVDDVTQDACVIVWRFREKWDPAKGGWLTWCGQAARSAIRAKRRSYIKQRATLQRESEMYYDADRIACPVAIAAMAELKAEWDRQIEGWKADGIGIDSRMLYNLYDRLHRKIKGARKNG